VLIEKTITAKTRELEGVEYCQFRRYERLYDLDGDGADDLVVLFAVEGTGGGGNNVITFMAVFPSRMHWRPLVIKTGERGVRLPQDIRIEGKTILLDTLEYLEGDPMFCPTGKGELGYEVKEGVLRRVK
jgi:hypothetical protein